MFLLHDSSNQNNMFFIVIDISDIQRASRVSTSGSIHSQW